MSRHTNTHSPHTEREENHPLKMSSEFKIPKHIKKENSKKDNTQNQYSIDVFNIDKVKIREQI